MVQKVPETNIKYILDKTNPTSRTVFLFLPGMSGEALTGRYISLAKSANQMGSDFVRMESWGSMEEFERKTLRELTADISAMVSFLQDSGYPNIGAIGKSFSGMLLLACEEARINRMVLWAPSLSVGTSDTTTALQDIPLSDVKSISELKISTNTLRTISTPTLIIHGTSDNLIPVENSRLIASSMPNATLHEIPNMGHTPKDEEIQIVIDMSLEYLRIKPS